MMELQFPAHVVRADEEVRVAKARSLQLCRSGRERAAAPVVTVGNVAIRNNLGLAEGT